MVQPVTQQPAAHAGGAFIEQREKARRRLAAQGLGELEVAARGRVEAQVFACALGRDRGHVRERLPLRLAGVFEQRAAGADGERQVFAAEARERRGAELLEELLAAAVDVELPWRQPRDEPSLQMSII